MQRKTFILIVTLTILVAVVGYFAFRSLDSDRQAGEQVPSDLSDAAKVAELSFESPNVQVQAANTDQTIIPIYVDTKDVPLIGIQIEAKYDPKVLRDVTIDPVFPSMLGQDETNIVVLHRDNNTETGNLIYIAGIQPHVTPQSGRGQVAALLFSINPLSKATETMIEILPTTMVSGSTSNESILKSAQNLKIEIVR